MLAGTNIGGSPGQSLVISSGTGAATSRTADARLWLGSDAGKHPVIG